MPACAYRIPDDIFFTCMLFRAVFFYRILEYIPGKIPFRNRSNDLGIVIFYCWAHLYEFQCNNLYSAGFLMYKRFNFSHCRNQMHLNL